jgi:hypothetical protein
MADLICDGARGITLAMYYPGVCYGVYVFPVCACVRLVRVSKGTWDYTIFMVIIFFV